MNETTQREISSTQSCKRPHDSGDPATGLFFYILGSWNHGSLWEWVPYMIYPPSCMVFFDVFRGENENEPNQSWGYPTFRETNVLIYRVDRDISTVSTFPFHPHVPRPCLLPSSNMAVNWTASLNGQFQFNGKTIYNWRIVQRHVWLPECISFMCPVLFVKSSCGSVSKFEIPSFNVFRHFPL